MSLHAVHLLHDERFQEGKRLMLAALAKHQRKIKGIRPAKNSLKDSYAQAITELSDMRGGSLFYPYLGSGIGNGPLVELADGSIKYDMIAGIGVHYLGHSDPELTEACVQAAFEDTVMQGNLQQSVQSHDVVQRFLHAAQRPAPGSGETSRLKHCFLTTSGAMANENALKMICQKHAPAERVLAFERCFMGRSMAMAAITDREKYREGLPRTLHVDYVPFFDEGDPEGSTQRALDVLHQHLTRHAGQDGGQHAGMCLELVQGEGGYYPGRRDFFLRIIEVLRRYGIAVMVDEVQTFGRTTEPFAFQHFGLHEHVDVVTVGKNTQVCATLFTDDYIPKPGLISQTFTGASTSLAAAQVVLNRLLREKPQGADWLGETMLGEDGHIMRVHRRFVEHFEAIAARHPGLIHGPYGIGGMIAFTPMDGTVEQAKALAHRLFEEGVIVFIAGAARGGPARVRMLPPMPVITGEQIDEVMAVVERVLVTEAT